MSCGMIERKLDECKSTVWWWSACSLDKRRCYVLKKDEDIIIIRTRTSTNCYQMNETINSISMNVQMHDVELWHKKFGNVNCKLLCNLGHIGIVRGMPIFEKENKMVCGDWKVGKQTRAKHVQIGDTPKHKFWSCYTLIYLD